jgi:hypothetical protein
MVVTALGQTGRVDSYKEALFYVVSRLKAQHPNFDTTAPNVHGRFPYFSLNSEDLRRPKALHGSKLFVETNVGSNRIWEICRDLVRVFGHNPDDPSVLGFDTSPPLDEMAGMVVEPTRTRAPKGSRRRPVAVAGSW